jgi:hypothetical protein
VLISSVLLITLGLVLTSSNVLAINEGAPIWVLDPTTHSDHLTDYDLIISNDSIGDAGLGSSYVSVSGWYQVWVGPKGCMSSGPCTSIIAIVYLEISIEFPDLAIEFMKSGFQSYLNFTDITSQVPNALAAFMYNMSGLYMGFAIMNTRKHIISTAQLSVIPPTSSGEGTKSPIELSAPAKDATKDLLIAAGNAAGALSIPGYDLLIFLGISGVITAGIILRKKYHK